MNSASPAFTLDELQRACQYKPSYLQRTKVFKELEKRGEVVALASGLYVAVHERFRTSGGPWPNLYITDLMAHLEHPYYIGLESAATYYAPGSYLKNIFHIMTDRPREAMKVGRYTLEFHVNKHAAEVSKREFITPNGNFLLSTPETTVLDLVRYSEKADQLARRVDLVLKLYPQVNARSLIDLAAIYGTSSLIQRLGFLLEKCGGYHCPELNDWFKSRVDTPTRLIARRPRSRVYDKRWRLNVNAELPVYFEDRRAG